MWQCGRCECIVTMLLHKHTRMTLTMLRLFIGGFMPVKGFKIGTVRLNHCACAVHGELVCAHVAVWRTAPT